MGVEVLMSGSGLAIVISIPICEVWSREVP